MFYVFLGVGDLNARETGVPERHEEEEAAVCVSRARAVCVWSWPCRLSLPLLSLSSSPLSQSTTAMFKCDMDATLPPPYISHAEMRDSLIYLLCPLSPNQSLLRAECRVAAVSRKLPVCCCGGGMVRRRPVAGGSQPPRADGARPWEHLFSFAGRKARNEIQKPREERNKRVEKESNKKMTTTTTQTTKKKKKKKKLKRSFKRRSTWMSPTRMTAGMRVWFTMKNTHDDVWRPFFLSLRFSSSAASAAAGSLAPTSVIIFIDIPAEFWIISPRFLCLLLLLLSHRSPLILSSFPSSSFFLSIKWLSGFLSFLLLRTKPLLVWSLLLLLPLLWFS